MATIKSYTDIQQSKKLAKILPHESADMEYMFLKKDGSKVSNVPFVKDGFEEPECCYTFIPCWSLAALFDVLPNGLIMKKVPQKKGNYYYFTSTFIEFDITAENPIDACVVIIDKLHDFKIL